MVTVSFSERRCRTEPLCERLRLLSGFWTLGIENSAAAFQEDAAKTQDTLVRAVENAKATEFKLPRVDCCHDQGVRYDCSTGDPVFKRQGLMKL